LEAKELSKNFNDFAAVKEVNFSIDQGEIFGFLGPNGAGKTSTINMLTGLARPTSGSITLAGIDCVKNIKKAQQIMGIVPDESNLYDDLDGFGNLCFCASLYGMRKAEREHKARQLLAEFDLDKAGSRPFKAYSKGMKRKLTIAAGIIHNPKILFLDEPTTGIDVESARHIKSLIVGLKKLNTTVFLTTHYIEDAQRICDRVAFIVEGKIVKTATVRDFMQNAQSGHIIRFVLSDNATAYIDELKRLYPDCTFEAVDSICECHSLQAISLLPIIKYFDEKGIAVYEAKSVHPSLEDVFVQITGIEAKKLKKEKEGGLK
jgi:ABC-2 type transport system ATP-binding protein